MEVLDEKGFEFRDDAGRAYLVRMWGEDTWVRVAQAHNPASGEVSYIQGSDGYPTLSIQGGAEWNQRKWRS